MARNYCVHAFYESQSVYFHRVFMRYARNDLRLMPEVLRDPAHACAVAITLPFQKEKDKNEISVRRLVKVDDGSQKERIGLAKHLRRVKLASAMYRRASLLSVFEKVLGKATRSQDCQPTVKKGCKFWDEASHLPLLQSWTKVRGHRCKFHFFSVT